MSDLFLGIYFYLLGKEQKPTNVGAQNRKGLKIRLKCKGVSRPEGHLLLLSSLHLDSIFPLLVSPAWGWNGEALDREIRNYINYINAGLPADLKGQSLGLCCKLGSQEDAERGGHE